MRMIAMALSKIGELGVAGVILMAVSLIFGVVSFLILSHQERKLADEIEKTYF